MKTLLIAIFILISTELFSQINSIEEWPKSIQQQFNQIKQQKIDTFLVYFSSYGPWSNLPDSCEGISDVWVVWAANNKYYARQIFCDSIVENVMPISDVPIKYFVSQINNFKLRNKYLKKKRFLPPIPTDGSWEHLILMTEKSRIYLSLSETQRTNHIWKNFAWIKPTIEAIDTTKNELMKYKNER